MRHIKSSTCLAVVLSLYFSAFSYAQLASQERIMEINFDTSQATQNWRAVNDGVMGGRSSGGPRFENGAMIFAGVVNTNGGGFSSVRTDVEAGVLNTASGISLRVKSDGRTYKLTLRSDARYRGRTVSFQAEIPQTPIGEWADVTVPFDSLQGSIFGRRVRGARFDKSEVRELGIIIADGQDGPFKLEVDWVKDCSK